MINTTAKEVHPENVKTNESPAGFQKVLKYSELINPETNDWCPGCGDNGIRTSQAKAIVDLASDPEYKRTIAYFKENGSHTDLTVITAHEEEAEDIALKTGFEKETVHSGLRTQDVMIVTGIGCFAKVTNQVKRLYTFHSLHGRAIPVAQGVKLANWDLEVITNVGDGDGLGIGGNHFFHAGRKNIDMTILIYDNQVYGLTKGQQSPTMLKNMRTKSMAAPAIKEGVNPITAAISCHYTFVAMSYSNQVKHLVEMILKAINHKGTSIINVLQPCPTYNDIFTDKFFKMRLHDLSDLKPDYDPVVRKPEERNKKMAEAYALGLEGYMRINPEDGERECFKGLYFQDDTVLPLEMLWAEKIGPTALAKRNIFDPKRKEAVRDLMENVRRI
ncbi:2-oxoacid:ferredoxin oxidoreductase subunit beta [candidate division KSB1 bacterium]|nr:2-oxoacid:ferredoxin oxidoreductase subunit beta [candidate division KSB1 bacterium]